MFPARAGMSLTAYFGSVLANDVPRASGDEPAKAPQGKHPTTCSPRERG